MNVVRPMRRYEVPGMTVALVREGETVWSGAYGYADVAEDRPMTSTGLPFEVS